MAGAGLAEVAALILVPSAAVQVQGDRFCGPGIGAVDVYHRDVEIAIGHA
jgi:hypothetical protein